MSSVNPVFVLPGALRERSDEVAAFTEGRTACVIAHTGDGLVMLLGPEQLELAGSVLAFEEALEAAVLREGVRWRIQRIWRGVA